MLEARRHTHRKVYRVMPPYTFDGKSAVVKEIHSTLGGWTEIELKREVRGLRDVDQLLAVIFDGIWYRILMKDMGNEWEDDTSLEEAEATRLMKEADKKWAVDYGLQRDGDPISPFEFTWTTVDGSREVVPVGEWRNAKYTGGVPQIFVKKNKHYCGIKEWVKSLPVFEVLDHIVPTVTVHHTGIHNTARHALKGSA
ncbi:hypothetical protein APHAL10511_003535 [Amanita phalloides]|nr:hypothetical protein APHAL10511_003535 [Amanita phalloides]